MIFVLVLFQQATNLSVAVMDGDKCKSIELLNHKDKDKDYIESKNKSTRKHRTYFLSKIIINKLTYLGAKWQLLSV